MSTIDTFTRECVDCGRTCDVINGKARRHWCRMPGRLRGRVGQAWADGERWVVDHAADYQLAPR